MVTRSQIDKLSSRINELAESLSLTRTVNVVIWGDEETEAEALERHLKVHPADRVAASYQFLSVDWMTNDEAGTRGWPDGHTRATR
jgi:hypothetical protein